jgi:hypothetical protein
MGAMLRALRDSNYFSTFPNTYGFAVAHVMLVYVRAGGLPHADLQGLGGATRSALFEVFRNPSLEEAS